MDSPARWFVPLVERPERPWHVLALPHTGAGCAAFADCAERLPADIATWGLNLPGRQARFHEPARTDLSGVIEDLVGDLAARPRRPYVLVGYCSGALLAFLLSRAVRAGGLPAPHALVVASYPPPQLVRPERGRHLLPTGPFWAEVAANGGFPAVLAAQPDFREVFEPALRGDYALLAGYEYEPQPPLDVPITVLVGARDPAVTEAGLAGWTEQTTRTCDVRRLDAGHWLLDDAPAEVAAAIEDVCRAGARHGA